MERDGTAGSPVTNPDVAIAIAGLEARPPDHQSSLPSLLTLSLSGTSAMSAT